MAYLLKVEDELYDVSPTSYDIYKKEYSHIGSIDDIIDILPSSNLYLPYLNDIISIGDEIFRPIEKFNNFSIISDSNNKIDIRGIKERKVLLTQVDDYDIKTDIVGNIQNILLEYSGYGWLIFSTNRGNSWYGMNENQNIVDIPIHDIDEIIIDVIENNGIPFDMINILHLPDNYNISSIRFMFVLYSPIYNENDCIKGISIKYEEKGHISRMEKSEYDLHLYDNSMFIELKDEHPIVKVNILIRETEINVEADTRIEIVPPILRLQCIDPDNIATIEWNIDNLVEYYKVYINSELYEDNYRDNSIQYNITNSQNINTVIVKAYPINSTRYKPSQYSNFIAIDCTRYLTTINGEYIGIVKDGQIYKLKLKK